jgi:glycine reductase
MKVVHYLNQFFAGHGAEEGAGQPPVRLEGPVGPGVAVAGLGLPIAVTLICGDNYFAEHEEKALSRLLGYLDEELPDVLLLGPSFGSGRYGYACGTLGREAARRGIPAVCGMHAGSPGIQAARDYVYVVPTTPNVAGMRDALGTMAGLALRLATGEDITTTEAGEYSLPNPRRNELAGETGAARAIELLLAKLAGNVRTELDVAVDAVPPPPPVEDLASATLALVTEAGCVPQGNPDRLASTRARTWFRYSLSGELTLSPERYQSVHGGFDVTLANEDPNRLVPLDTVRAIEREGGVGRLHDFFYTTSGSGILVAMAARFGQEIAEELKQAGVEAVLLSGT